jgi:hypothetical protein
MADVIADVTAVGTVHCKKRFSGLNRRGGTGPGIPYGQTGFFFLTHDANLKTWLQLDVAKGKFAMGHCSFAQTRH